MVLMQRKEPNLREGFATHLAHSRSHGYVGAKIFGGKIHRLTRQMLFLGQELDAVVEALEVAGGSV